MVGVLAFRVQHGGRERKNANNGVLYSTLWYGLARSNMYLKSSRSGWRMLLSLNSRFRITLQMWVEETSVALYSRDVGPNLTGIFTIWIKN